MGLFRKRSFRKKDQYLDMKYDNHHSSDDDDADENDENICPPPALTRTTSLSKSSISKNKNTKINKNLSNNNNTSNTSGITMCAPPPLRSGQPSSELSSEHQHHHHHHPQHQQQEVTHKLNVSLCAPSQISTSSSEQQQQQQQQQQSNEPPPPPSLQQIIHDLSTCQQTFSTAPSIALRHLFSCSEHNSLHERNRVRLVREDDGQLVPTLLTFLQRCEKGSSERYLTLLVLNNLSIPCENKRLVAIEHGGAMVLARSLCEDPACHVVGIILANLCFSDANLRRQLVCSESSVELIYALGYALRIALLPPDRQTAINKSRTNTTDKSPRQLLEEILERHPPCQKDDYSNTSHDEYNNRHIDENDELSFHHHHQNINQTFSYPETVRWCLCAIKSLTRPCRDPFAAHSLLESGLLPLIFEILHISHAEQQQDCNSDGRMDGISARTPNKWEPHSIHDSALYILLNLSITPSARAWLRREDAVGILANIASYSAASTHGGGGGEEEEKKLEAEEEQKGIQCLKARISLAFLLGSEGHFGQGRALRMTPKYIQDDPTNNVLLTKGSEAPILVELVSNSLHCRGKDGPGGYSASTFNAKKALFAVRCLLTNNLNVKTFYVTCGVKLNALLFKSIALHSIQLAPVVDAEAAEDACFSLYLLSNYGFMGPFLPSSCVGKDAALFVKVLLSYLRKPSITNAGKHAAEQLLMRSPYLNFDGALDDGDEPRSVQYSDFDFNDSLLHAAEAVEGMDIIYGVRPLDDIFGRPVMRHTVKRGGRGNVSTWDDDEDSVAYPSALNAVQHLSYGSSSVEHVGRLDDILIANNIVNNANGQQTELYGYLWSWQDDGYVFERDIQQRLQDLQTGKIDSVRGMISKVRQKKFMTTTEPLSIFGLKCGCNSHTMN